MQQLDLSLLLWLHDRPPALLSAMRAITVSGSYGGVFVLIGALLLLLGRGTWRQIGLRLLLGLLGILLLVDLILKPLIARPRPYTVLGRDFLIGPLPHGLSFPSGHAAAAFLGATVLAAYLGRYRVLLFVYAILVAWSRLYLGAHWPSDVIAGALIGIALGLLAIRIQPSHRVEVPSDGRTPRRPARGRKIRPGTGDDQP